MSFKKSVVDNTIQKNALSSQKSIALLNQRQKGFASRRQALGRGLENLFPPSEIQHKSLLDIEKIKPNPHQPRQVFDKNSLKDLSGSIKKNGLIQPVVVKKTSSHYEIVAGERRWRAAGLAGLHKIPRVDFGFRQNKPFSLFGRKPTKRKPKPHRVGRSLSGPFKRSKHKSRKTSRILKPPSSYSHQ